MKDFARSFYKSKQWQSCRNAYAKDRQFLCERCLKRGLFVPGEIVHHKIEVTPETIGDPSVTLNFDNLELLCRSCHGEAHSKKRNGVRYKILEDGSVVVDAPPGQQ